MARIGSSYRRKSRIRDTKFIVIATEGKCTEPQYFKALKNNYFNSKVTIHTLPANDNRSDVRNVIERAKSYKKELKKSNDYYKNDEFWAVFDFDKQRERELTSALTLANQDSINWGITRPCFEFWLLLHLKDLSEFTTEEKNSMLENKRVTRDDKYLDKILKEILVSYNKSRLNFNDFKDGVLNAIQRAELLNPDNEMIPHFFSTTVHNLVKRIIE